MTYVYAWLAGGIAYSTLCLFEKGFRKKFAAVSSINQTTTLVILTLLGPITSMVWVAGLVRGVCSWLRAKWKIRKLKQTTDELIESTTQLIDHLKENVHIKCECGHASKPAYFDTEDGGCDATWQCPKCGRTAPNVGAE